MQLINNIRKQWLSVGGGLSSAFGTKDNLIARLLSNKIIPLSFTCMAGDRKEAVVVLVHVHHQAAAIYTYWNFQDNF